ncbi:MAG: hypothetical protein GEV09_18390 [Pseudonocardiaceae bacterium]|nr:hypothetical protein [Pseudonocardiaceae bacterium]
MPTPMPEAVSAATVSRGCDQHAPASRRIQPVAGAVTRGSGTAARLCATADGYAVNRPDEEEREMDDTRARRLLDDTLAELDATAGTVREENEEFRDEQIDSGGRMSQHPADYASDVVNRNERDLFLGDARQEREQVLAAQRRLDEGIYGICVDCGQLIDDDRLEVRPQAARCLPCEQRAEQRAGH